MGHYHLPLSKPHLKKIYKTYTTIILIFEYFLLLSKFIAKIINIVKITKIS